MELLERWHLGVQVVGCSRRPATARAPDVERLKTIDYGGGARWFAKRHLAFSFDVRFYAINPSTPVNGLPPSPRTRLFVVGAGVSIK